MVEKIEWSPVQIPSPTLKECEEFGESLMGKKMGFTKKSQVVNAACREFLDKYAREYFFDIENKPLNLSLSFTVKSGEITCSLCHSKKCDHINEILLNESIQEIIKKRNVKIAQKPDGI